MSDERPKKSWREIDAQRDRSSGGRRDERPRAGTRAGARSEAAQKQYRSALDRMFSGSGVGKLLPDMPAMPTDPATADRQELLRAVRQATGRAEIEQAARALLARFPLPDDPEVLAQLLRVGDDALVRAALEKLQERLPLGPSSGREVLKTRLRNLEEDPDRDADVRALAAAVRSKA